MQPLPKNTAVTIVALPELIIAVPTVDVVMGASALLNHHALRLVSQKVSLSPTLSEPYPHQGQRANQLFTQLGQAAFLMHQQNGGRISFCLDSAAIFKLTIKRFVARIEVLARTAVRSQGVDKVQCLSKKLLIAVKLGNTVFVVPVALGAKAHRRRASF